MKDNWVLIWGQAHSALSHFYYPSCEKTFRFVINSAVSGNKIRIELSNEFAKTDVYIGNITVAICEKNGKFLSPAKGVTLDGKKEIILKQGEVISTDEVELNIGTGDYVAVSIFVKKGDLRSGNLLDNVELLTVKGDVTEISEIINQRRKRDKVREVAGKILNLYLHKPLPLIQSVQVLNNTSASSIVVFGDSLSQQGFWTNRFEQRIREAYPGKYSVINKAIMGNRVLRDYSSRFPCKGLFGPSGLNRLQRDILDYSDVSFVVLALGTNDFLQFGTIAAPKSEKPTADEVYRGIRRIYDTLEAKGIKVIVINTVKFGYCIDSRPEKEKLAAEYNEMLERHKDEFFAVFDQATLLQDKNKPNCTGKEYLGKDNLHFNTSGGEEVANNFPLDMF